MSEDTTTTTTTATATDTDATTVTVNALYLRGTQFFIAVSDTHLEGLMDPNGDQIPATREFSLYALPETPSWISQMTLLRRTLANDLRRSYQESQRLRDQLQFERKKYEELGQALLEKAIEKDWCDEYDEFAEDWELPKRTREYTVTIEIPVKATSPENAEELVEAYSNVSCYEDWFIDYPSVYVSDR